MQPHDSTHEIMIDSIIYTLDGNIDYIKFLIAEQPYIRSAMEATSPPVDPDEAVGRYPTSVGSALHCDLIELESWFKDLSPSDRGILSEWASRTRVKPYFAAAKIRRVNHLIGKFPSAKRRNHYAK